MPTPGPIPARPSRTPAAPVGFDDLAVALNARGLSAAELAKLAGLPARHVEELITGQRRLGFGAARRIAPHLGDVTPSGWIRRARTPRVHERGIVGVN